MTTTKPELKTCPFCHRQVRAAYHEMINDKIYWEINCRSDKHSALIMADTEEEATTEWNTRANIPDPVNNCESCEGTGRIECLPDCPHSSPCDDCNPAALKEFNRGYNAANYIALNEPAVDEKHLDRICFADSKRGMDAWVYFNGLTEPSQTRCATTNQFKRECWCEGCMGGVPVDDAGLAVAVVNLNYIKKLAFEIPPQNSITPQIVQAVQHTIALINHAVKGEKPVEVTENCKYRKGQGFTMKKDIGASTNTHKKICCAECCGSGIKIVDGGS